MHATIIDYKTKYAPRVTKGAEFLDSQEPGWYTRISLTTLSFPSMECCVLGQLKGHYHDALHEFGKDCDWGIENGFSVTDEDFAHCPWEVITDLWKAEIQKRLDAEVAV